MPSLLINAALLLISGAFGLGAGWFIWARKAKPSEEAKEPTTDVEKELADLQQREDRADDVVQRVRELIENVALEVEEHSERVTQASDRLVGEKSQVKEVVDAIEAILSANSQLRSQLSEAEMKLATQSEIIASHVKEARTDALTQLSNRRAFDSEVDAALAELDTSNTPSTAILFDVDHFKQLNDKHGHIAGDEVLKQVARALRRATRMQGRVFRYGGEEFAIVLRNTKAEDAFALCQEARLSIKSHAAECNGNILSVTASAGLAELHKNQSTADWIESADKAMYEAKKNGRDRAYWRNSNRFQPIPDQHDADLDEEATGGSTVEEVVDVSWRTAFSNREQFVDDVYRRVSANRRNGGIDSLILVSVDGLDAYQKSGDAKLKELLLRATSQFLKASVRDMDHIAVFENNVFGIWLPTAALENAARIGERIRVAIAKCKVPLGGKMVKFTVSLGVAQNMPDDTDDSVLERCDKARAYADERGGNCCYVTNKSSFVDARMMPDGPSNSIQC